MTGFASYSKLGNMGRCCNAMWQLSALISYCNKHDKKPLFPDWKYLKYFKNLPEPTENIPKFSSAYNEPAFHYNAIPYFDSEIELTGYYQSILYHSHVNVQDLFELKDEYKKQVDDLWNKINPNGLKTISLHFRRTDYLNPGTLEYHGVLNMDYYTDAVNTILFGHKDGVAVLHEEDKNPFDDYIFVVFSDDIPYCREQMKHNDSNVVFVEGNEDIIDLFLMARCTDNIIANSSFSYWGALLNRNPNKRVVAPAKWFNEAKCNTKDLIPENWIKI